jgi:hypothetical protein
MIPSGPLFHKPNSILAAKNILYASIFLGLLGILISSFGTAVSISYTSVLSNLTLLVLLFIAVRYMGLGKTWARNLFLILFICNLIASRFYLPFALRTSTALAYLFILQLLLQIAALVFIYKRSSTEWFNRFAGEGESK